MDDHHRGTEKIAMFRKSEIGAKCNCDVPETVRREHGLKRYRLPAGYYGDYWQPAHYYSAGWWTLHCEQCGNVRKDIHIYRWHGQSGLHPIIPAFPKEKDFAKAKDIRETLITLMDD